MEDVCEIVWLGLGSSVIFSIGADIYRQVEIP